MKSALVLSHIFGVSLGLGVCVAMDWLLLRMLVRNIPFSDEHLRVFTKLSNLIITGLGILWISGLGFLFYYNAFAPEALLNPKIYAKAIIVMVLSLNGIVIHHYVFPLLHRCRGAGFFTCTTSRQRHLMFAAGAVSMVSWASAFLLGAVSELNFTFSISEIIAAYLMVASCGVALSFGLLMSVHRLSEARLGRCAKPRGYLAVANSSRVVSH